MLKRIHLELIIIRKELQAIRQCLEFNKPIHEDSTGKQSNNEKSGPYID